MRGVCWGLLMTHEINRRRNSWKYQHLAIVLGMAVVRLYLFAILTRDTSGQFR